MRTDDVGYVGRLHASVPYPCRIDDHYRALITQSHAAAGSKLHLVVEAALLYLAIERAEHSDRPSGRAGGDAFWFLLGADEEMQAERFHRGLQS